VKVLEGEDLGKNGNISTANGAVTLDLRPLITRLATRLGVEDNLKANADPRTLVWDREGALHAAGGHPTDVFAVFCGTLRVGWRFCQPADPQAKGLVERLQGFIETSFEPGRVFANELDFQEQLDRWFDERANARIHKTLRCRPADRLADEGAAMRPLPDQPPDTDAASSRGSRPTRTCASTQTKRSDRGQPRQRRARLPPPALVRQAAHIHGAWARPCPARATAKPIEPEVELRPLARYDALIPA
jgi:hypothetical protein